MSNVRLSLIGTSQGGREKEIFRLLESLVSVRDSVELVFVDQTRSDAISSVFDKFIGLVNFNLIKTDPCSLSIARNLALDNAKGDIIGFCDDDAFYSASSLDYICNLTMDGAIVSVPVVDQSSGNNYAGRKFPSHKGVMSYSQVIKYSLSVGTFIFKKTEKPFSERFDERLGVGTPLGGSEETELFFRLKSEGFSTVFDPAAFVFHDNDMPSPKQNDLSLKYQRYATGYAVVIKKYLMASNGTLGAEIVNVLGRSSIGLLFPSRRKVCWGRLKGFVSGLVKHRLV